MAIRIPFFAAWNLDHRPPCLSLPLVIQAHPLSEKSVPLSVRHIELIHSYDIDAFSAKLLSIPLSLSLAQRLSSRRFAFLEFIERAGKL